MESCKRQLEEVLQNSMRILGINAFHGDSSACLIEDGELVAAAEEERFRRINRATTSVFSKKMAFATTTSSIPAPEILPGQLKA